MPTLTPSSRAWPARWWQLSGTGLFFAAGYFLISMSPSLLPRTWYYQGVISGLSAAAGYGLGVLVAWIVRGLARLIDLRISVSPETGHFLRVALPVLSGVAVVALTFSNVRSQGRTAEFLGLPPLRPVDWIGAIALAVGLSALLLAIARGLRRATHRLAEAAGQVLPRTLASIIAVVVVATATLWVSDSVLFHRGMQAMAAMAAQVNAKQPIGRTAPTSPLISGGPGSLESYASLGYQGQMFVTSAPSAEQIGEATGRTALEPIRVYAGRGEERTIDQVADAVLAELHRTNAFDRSVLAVITTTGTGWVDDWSVQAIEYLTNGDSATAAMQYSYLPSAMALITDRESTREAGRVLFDRIHAVWSRLPEDARPKLVVGGESLGSYGGHAAFADADDMLRRADGGVWVGTPSFTEIHAELTAARTPGSPQIAPVIEDGRHFRFVTSADELTHDYYGRDYGEWAFPRYVYAQHPSDPVVWWDPAILGAEPDWLREPRGRDVNPDVTWIPFVTFWQLTTDMAVGHDPADGFGHRYGPELIPAWGAVLGGVPGQDYRRIIAGVEKTVYRTE
ncbi:alpha/beta hydrolase [Intrasporangium sp.]|uniref:alpha/beta hydrolase n=1 Tax=Intrasporangium sp. TaxID=1925024 RepID=UPI00293B4319|nr:alpha/beta-hydrolase family protein [Intrasporangium sp.]MDV3219835.1 alpha/beta-hydrolase family protein [Intrasporangium sp.]